MFHLHIITLGKLKEVYWRQAEVEYIKRLQPFVKLVIHELKEESFSEKDNREMIKEREAKKIESEIEKIKDSYLIVLDEHGKQFSSTQLAQSLNDVTVQQSNNLIFVIGGPLGLYKSIRQRANLNLSLSLLTFTHQMARIFLLEQIYRVMMITNERNYHY